MSKSKRSKKTKSATADMSAAEATVATLIAHGLDTVYALPGVHNDHLFDALQRAGERLTRRAHPPRAGRRLYGAGRGAGDRPAAGLCGGAGPGPAQFRRGAAHRLRHERAGAGADRADSGGGDRPRRRAPARDHRPGTASSPGWSIIARASTARARRQPRSPRRSARCAKAGPARPRSNAPSTSGASAPALQRLQPPSPPRQPRIDEDARAPRGQAARQGQARAHRRRRRRAGCVAGSDAALQHAAGAGHVLPARSRRARRPRSLQRDPAARARPVGRGRCGAGGRHQAALRAHPMGHRPLLANRQRRRRQERACALAQAERSADRATPRRSCAG